MSFSFNPFTGNLDKTVTHDPVTVLDGTTIDFTLSGQQITGEVIQGAIDHGSIAGLSDDDHPQYALLAGRSGGQSLIGGTASGDDLTLQSTSNATKGKIFFGSNSVYDEVNDRLGINTTSPQLAIDSAGDTNGDYTGLLMRNDNAGNAAQTSFRVYNDGGVTKSFNFTLYGTSHSTLARRARFTLNDSSGKMDIFKSGVGSLIYFDSSGTQPRVGIGTTSPLNHLHIKQAANNRTAGIRVEDVSNSDYIFLSMYAADLGSLAVSDGGGHKSLVLQPDGGNVGIGTGSSTPATKLEINGALTLREMSAPSTPASNKGVLYLVDDGDGTQTLYVKFDDGTAVAIAAN